MISRELYLMGRESEYPTDETIEINIARLLYRVNKLLKKFGNTPHMNSGYRPGRYNTLAGGSKRSAHLTGEAIDLTDPSPVGPITLGPLKAWIQQNPEVLVEFDLYMESPTATPNWCHLQTRPTNNRIFKP